MSRSFLRLVSTFLMLIALAAPVAPASAGAILSYSDTAVSAVVLPETGGTSVFDTAMPTALSSLSASHMLSPAVTTNTFINGTEVIQEPTIMGDQVTRTNPPATVNNNDTVNVDPALTGALRDSTSTVTAAGTPGDSTINDIAITATVNDADGPALQPGFFGPTVTNTTGGLANNEILLQAQPDDTSVNPYTIGIAVTFQDGAYPTNTGPTIGSNPNTAPALPEVYTATPSSEGNATQASLNQGRTITKITASVAPDIELATMPSSTTVTGIGTDFVQNTRAVSAAMFSGNSDLNLYPGMDWQQMTRAVVLGFTPKFTHADAV